MNPADRPIADEKFTHKLHRHLINLMCLDRGELALKKYDGSPAIYNFSAFVVELEGVWLAVTAGHIFSGLKAAIAAGSKISDWNIDDSSVSNGPARPYPIHLDLEHVLFFHDDVPGMDYAAFILHPLTVTALRGQGIVPITEDLWEGDDFSEYPHWILTGTPYMPDLLHGRSTYEKYIMCIQLRQREDAPPGIEKKEFQCLYADLDWDSVEGERKPTTVDGMSGGPIFALDIVNTSGDYKYKVIGIQSSRNDSGSIAFCAAPPFLKGLKETFRRLIAKQANGSV
jgi:hypothetical protein